MSQTRITLCASFLFLYLASHVYAEQVQLTDEKLLEDLGAELLKPSTKKLAVPPVQRILEQPSEDTGDGRAAKNDWLAQVVAHMQKAQTLLNQTSEAGGARAAQAKALVGLDTRIAEIKQRQRQCQGGQCSGGQCNKPGQPKSSKKAGGSSKAGDSPAKAAAARGGADLSTEQAVAGELVKDLWGHLPERQREQILQPLSEEFLPKYASEIEAYFRALADPNRNLLESR